MKTEAPDGTLLHAAQSGAGPPLLLVHGAGFDHTIWAPTMPALARGFAVYALDRRGHGESGDGPAYSLERELEDIAAVCAAIGEPLTLLGHGFGGLTAMEAARRVPGVTRLVVYEPWIIGARVLRFGVLDRLQALLDGGDREALLATFLRDVTRLTTAELEQLRAAPPWPAQVWSAPTILREMRALQGYRFDAMPFRRLPTPTLLMQGEASIPSAGRQVWIAHEALPISRIITLTGQRHLAMLQAPDLFTRELLAFVAA